MKQYVKEKFGTAKGGKEVTRYTLENDNGMRLSVLDYGCRIQSLYVPDEDGDLVNVVMGFTGMERYEKRGCFGALIGRFANRIRDARFTLDGTEYRLDAGDRMHYIHGNYEHTLFRTEPSDDRLVFTYRSPTGESGFPGSVELKATYALTEDNTVDLIYEAETDAPTVINITNHSYFNLDGLPENSEEVSEDTVNICSHLMTLCADSYLEADDLSMVTGRETEVGGTVFDFRKERDLGSFKYDHNFCIKGWDGSLRKAAVLKGAGSGIVMECRTTQPGLQLYTGAKKAVALETQHYPDSPNHPEWPSTVLRPGELYKERTSLCFSAV